jgi:5-methylthioadenosine/S-adenosylhomocysteine deaminase
MIKKGFDLAIIKGKDLRGEPLNVGISNGIIEYCGRGEVRGGENLNAEGCILLPGFVNLHTHVGMTVLRGFADDMRLERWLREKIWPVEKRMKKEDVRISTLLGIAEMIKSGTTCFVDMYFHMDEVAEAVISSGIRAVLSYGMVDLGDEKKRRAELKEADRFFKKWNGKNERLKIFYAPHSTSTTSEELLLEVRERVEKNSTGVTIHCAETEEEVKNGSPVELLKKIGLLNERTILNHCVFVDRRDIEMISKGGAHVCHCPTSNLKLGNGIAPIMEMMGRGVNVGLGTDGCASNNNLDMMEEMHICSLIHKGAKRDASVFQAEECLKMATLNGARALGMKYGIEEGALADIIALDVTNLKAIPQHSLVSNIVYSMDSNSVIHAVVNGRILMEERELLTIDEERIKEEARRVAEKLREV